MFKLRIGWIEELLIKELLDDKNWLQGNVIWL
jgi:hypothetical protein